MKYLLSIVALIVVMFCITAQAMDVITVYKTTISPLDRYNSYGEKLNSVRDILRQDRANMYEYGNADPGDQSDSFFNDPANRNLFSTIPIRINPALARQILKGKFTNITVYVLPDYIEVR